MRILRMKVSNFFLAMTASIFSLSAQASTCPTPPLNQNDLNKVFNYFRSEIRPLLAKGGIRTSSIAIRVVDQSTERAGYIRYRLQIVVTTREGVRLDVLQISGPVFKIRESSPKFDRLGREAGCFKSEIFVTGGGFAVVNSQTGVNVLWLQFDPDSWLR